MFITNDSYPSRIMDPHHGNIRVSCVRTYGSRDFYNHMSGNFCFFRTLIFNRTSALETLAFRTFSIRGL